MSTNMKNFKIFGLSPLVFLFPLVTVLLAHFTNSMPTGILGALAFCFVFGAIFGEIGDRLPIWNQYIGGAPVLIFIAAGFFVYKGWFSKREIDTINSFMKDTKFLNLYIVSLLTGSIFAVNRKLLIRSLAGYIPTILGGLLGASILGVLVGKMFGLDFPTLMMTYVMPTMGGGNGAGAVPMSEIYHNVTGKPKEAFYSFAMAVLTIANIWAIIFASLLNKLGKKKPSLTGNGVLVRKGNLEVVEDKILEITSRDIGAAAMIATASYTLGYFFYKVVYSGIHYYAYTVLIVAILNMLGFIPLSIQQGTQRIQKFVSKQCTWLLMVGVGVSYMDFAEIMAAVNVHNLIIAFFIVLGAIIGSGFVGYLVGFYPIEAAITAGLCMANRGGTGDIEVLGASNRMNLISYAQISSRLGGGIILIIASILFGMLG